MCHATGELTKGFHFLRPGQLILQLFARGHIHEGTDQPHGFAIRIANNHCAFEQLKIVPVGAAKAILATPMFGVTGEGVADASGDPCPVGRVNALLPESDVTVCGRLLVAEQSLQALGPAEDAAAYIPIPNCIVRSPGKEWKIFRAFCRITFR